MNIVYLTLHYEHFNPIRQRVKTSEVRLANNVTDQVVQNGYILFHSTNRTHGIRQKQDRLIVQVNGVERFEDLEYLMELRDHHSILPFVNSKEEAIQKLREFHSLTTGEDLYLFDFEYVNNRDAKRIGLRSHLTR